ncbi:conserved hypothetical protein [Rhodopseudomonas palustris HaA2]|uniref:Phage tail assembly chaperone n=1 Tax=Rhodopseudomonas palustris (strain HaA2) TaxID=316058 RepID=Q2IUF1_RHOP2|nr:rcc01693 family protein [Rhodopseudomonas palustris]ABD08159.1 conserved hypothetical protein [Rhodopseudomonas palustris HaA2]
MTPFPWAEAMQFGFGVLRLSSEQFWRMTPREFASALIGARGGIAAPLDRGGLDELMRRYPDHQEQAR